MRWPGRMTRMAASSPVAAAWMTSAARPLTAALASSCTTTVVAALVMKPSMCVPKSLQFPTPITLNLQISWHPISTTPPTTTEDSGTFESVNKACPSKEGNAPGISAQANQLTFPLLINTAAELYPRLETSLIAKAAEEEEEPAQAGGRVLRCLDSQAGIPQLSDLSTPTLVNDLMRLRT